MDQNIDLTFSLAQQAHKASDLLKAESLYRQILEINYQHAGALYFLGILYGQKNNYNDSVYYLKKALKLMPDNPEFCYNVAEAYRRKGELGQAENYLIKTIDLKPDFTEAYYNLGKINKDRGNLDDAIKFYQKAISINPQHFNSYHSLGYIMSIQKNFAESVNYLKQALNINSNNAEIYYNIGLSLENIGETGEAIENYKEAIKLNPQYLDAYNNLENLLKNTVNNPEEIDNISTVNAQIELSAIKRAQVIAKLPAKIVIQEYTWNCYGFADFIRSALMLHKICKTYNVEFYVRFVDHPFSEFFYCKKAPLSEPEINSLPLLNLFYHNLINKYSMVVHEFINALKGEQIQIRIRTNNDFILPSPSFYPMDSILKPTEEVLKKKNQLITEFNLRPGEYNSFHVRLGDSYLLNNKPITSKDNEIIDKVEAYIRDIIHSYPEKKLLLFTDTQELKEIICRRIPEVLTLKTRLIHVGFNKNQDISGFIDTICEFLILGEGNRIYSFSGPELKSGIFCSGFPKWSAIVHGKEYFLLK